MKPSDKGLAGPGEDPQDTPGEVVQTDGGQFVRLPTTNNPDGRAEASPDEPLGETR